MRITLYILVLCTVLGCKKGNDCFTSKGDDGVLIRQVGLFDRISVEDRIELIIVQDSATAGEIELSGPENLLEQISTEVVEGELQLKNNNTCNFVRSYDYSLKVKVCLRLLVALNVDGVASVSTQDTVLIDKLDIDHIALSDINLILSGSEIFLRSRNSAKTILRGRVDIFKASIEEISDVDGSDLEAAEVFLDSHTPLDCFINASRGIFVNIYNSGSIYYEDEPIDYKIIESHLGSGVLLKR